MTSATLLAYEQPESAMIWLEDPDVRRSRIFAIQAHGEQRYGELPYVVHLDAVVAELFRCEASKVELMAGYLHDVYEDCLSIEKEALFMEFGGDVASTALSMGSRAATRAESQSEIVAQLLARPRGALAKLCDRVVNMRYCVQTGKKSLLKRYIRETSLYLPVFEPLVAERSHPAVTALFRELNEFHL